MNISYIPFLHSLLVAFASPEKVKEISDESMRIIAADIDFKIVCHWIYTLSSVWKYTKLLRDIGNYNIITFIIIYEKQ